MTQFISFYSFKGGVGRTSALMNVARHLAEHNKKVLVIDADIAAPGIDIFEILNPDLVDYPSYNPYRREIFRRCRKYLEKKPPKLDWERQIEKAIREKEVSFEDGGEREKSVPVNWFSLEQLYEKHKGEIDREVGIEEKDEDLRYKGLVEFLVEKYMKKGRGKDGEAPLREYLQKLKGKSIVEADIQMMRAGSYDGPHYKQYDKDQRDLIEKLSQMEDEGKKSAAAAKGNGKHAKKGEVEYSNRLLELANNIRMEIVQELEQPDYVLVDCRPGRDIVTRFFTQYFTDINVLMFNLNPWNFSGIEKTYNDIEEFRKWIRENRKNSGDRSGNMQVLLAASPVPRHAENNKLYANQINVVNELMRDAYNVRNKGRKIVQVPFSEVLLLRDVLICDFDPADLANAAYRELADLIMDMNTEDVQVKIRRIRDDATRSDREKIEQLKTLASIDTRSAMIEQELARLQMKLGTVKELINCIEALERAAERDGVPLGKEYGSEEDGQQDGEYWSTGFKAENRIMFAEACYELNNRSLKPRQGDELDDKNEKTLEETALRTARDILALLHAIVDERRQHADDMDDNIRKAFSRKAGGKHKRYPDLRDFSRHWSEIYNMMTSERAGEDKRPLNHPFRQNEARLLHAMAMVLDVIASCIAKQLRARKESPALPEVGGERFTTENMKHIAEAAGAFALLAEELDRGRTPLLYRTLYDMGYRGVLGIRSLHESLSGRTSEAA